MKSSKTESKTYSESFSESESANKFSEKKENLFKKTRSKVNSVAAPTKRLFADPSIHGNRGDGRLRGSVNFNNGRSNISKNVFQQHSQQQPGLNGSDGRSDDDGSVAYVSNWGYRSNLIDQNGRFQRATTNLKNYITYYKAKYCFYFDLVNGRYPQFVRKLPNNLEIWRMSFNVYASGFSEYIAHLGLYRANEKMLDKSLIFYIFLSIIKIGEIHGFYQMEQVENELLWVYKDFNFYPNKMRYGFRVNSYDIADVHSRFIKFICLRESVIKQFPYVNITHHIFIFQKYGENLRNMMNRLHQVKLIDENINSGKDDVEHIPSSTTENNYEGRNGRHEDQLVQRNEHNGGIFNNNQEPPKQVAIKIITKDGAQTISNNTNDAIVPAATNTSFKPKFSNNRNNNNRFYGSNINNHRQQKMNRRGGNVNYFRPRGN